MKSSREITVRAIDLEALGIEISYINSDNLHDIQKAQANARLIAAAPELLDALQAIIASDGQQPAVGMAWTKAKLAIAKTAQQS